MTKVNMYNDKQRIGQIIKRLRKAKRWTQDRLIEEVREAIDSSNLSRIENGKIGVSHGKLDIIAKALGTSAAEILGEALGGETILENTPPCRSVPVRNWEDIKDQNATDWMQTSYNCSNDTFALEVAGDSMTSTNGPSFPPGTLIAIDPQLSPKDQQLAVTKSDTGQARFRRLVVDGDQQYLMPLNSQYPAEAVTRNTNFIGVVVDASLRKLL